MRFSTVISANASDFVLRYSTSHQPEKVVQYPECARLGLRNDEFNVDIARKFISDGHEVLLSFLISYGPDKSAWILSRE